MYYLFVAIGASLGAIIRWKISIWLNGLAPSFFLGTLFANFIGSFLIGVFFCLIKDYIIVPESMRILFITGLCGSLTTFSAFSLETLLMLYSKNFLAAFFNIFISLIGCIGSTFLGIKLMDAVLSK